MSNANRSPAPNILQINRPVTYIAHQRTGTCVTDAFETILCFSDGIRQMFLEPFRSWLTPERAEGLTDSNPEFQELIRTRYNNSNYARSILIRYLERQKLEVRPMIPQEPGKWLRRMPSRNGTRGNVARRDFEMNAAIASCDDETGIPVLKSLLPGVDIFNTKPPLQANWAQTLVGVECLTQWIIPQFHAFAFIKNHGEWYFCESTYAYAFKVHPRFYNHLINSFVLEKKIEWNSDPSIGVVMIMDGVPLTFIVDDEEISVIPKKFLPEQIQTLSGGLGQSAKLSLKEYGHPHPILFYRYGKVPGRFTPGNYVCFFLKSGAPLLTEEEQGTLEAQAAAEKTRLIAESQPAPITVWRELYAAIEKSDEETALRLIHAGASLTIRQVDKYVDNGSTVLHLACRKNLEAVVDAILKAPGKKFVDKEDGEKNTPLMMACQNNNVRIISLLLEVGAKLNERNKYGETALCIACKFKHKDVALLLIQQEGIDINLGNPLSLIEGDASMADVTAALLAKGADRNAETLYQYGNSSPSASSRQLEAAIRAGDFDFASRLIARGAKGTSEAFIMAGLKGWRKMALKFLENREIKVNGVAGATETPLNIAAALLNDTDMIRELHEQGVDLNAKVRGYFTALYYACNNFKEEAALLLIDLGADVTLGNPITMFRGNRMPRVKAALLAAGAKDPLVEGGDRRKSRKKRQRQQQQQQRATRKKLVASVRIKF